MNNKNIFVLYHKNCLDGFGSAFICWLKFGDRAEYIPVQYNEEPPNVSGKELYIVDFSYPRDILLEMKKKALSIVVLDHHKTAEESLKDLDFTIFNMEKSGVGITWEYFYKNQEMPMFLQYIQDRDLWKFEFGNTTKAFTKVLYDIVGFDFNEWKKLLSHEKVSELLTLGEKLLKIEKNQIEYYAKISHDIVLDGIKGKACNAPKHLTSELGNELARHSKTFGLVYNYNGDIKKWIYSLRSVGNFDVSKIALKYGGGGHRNAAGFITETLLNF